MKKALQNPFVVGTLAVLAILVVFRTTFKQAAPAAAMSVGAQSKKPNTAKAAESKPESGHKKINTVLAQWTTAALNRNPFNATSETPEITVLEQQAPRINPVSETEPPQLKLSAIWHENDRQLVVINDKILTKGETLLEFQIEEILSDHVILSGSGGRIVVGFRESLTPSDLKVQPLADSSGVTSD
ncbi:MAG: hypothetical protein ACI9R3_004574 [Verrucomicrobiales bacterium]|jgi:hypothetical protein